MPGAARDARAEATRDNATMRPLVSNPPATTPEHGGDGIRYTVARTALGTVALGATARGLRGALFIDDPAHARQALAEEFPGAALTEDAPALATYVEAACTAADGRPAPDVPLDLLGTPFQRRVWDELRSVPNGSTATYTAIAERIGAPRAVRAVAGACARNHVALLVPCHRIVRSDGGWGGYRWGIDRKRAILEAETR